MTDLRPIDLGGRPRRRGRKATPPLLTWLAIDRLRLDDSYQRPLGEGGWKNIETIAADFDWGRFTPILAAPIDDGLFAIIDGQHRTHAAALRGFDAVPAMVVPMSHAEQARAFAWVNGQVTAITVFHVYKAALAAMEPWALDARAVVEAAGCTLRTANASTQSKKPREVYAIGLIREHVGAGRAEMVTGALRALADSEMGGWAEAWMGWVVKGYLAALAALDDWRAVDLDGFLAAHDIVEVYDRIDVMRQSRDGLARQPRSAVYRQTLVALLRQHMGLSEVAA